jgi:hypothetical protein
MKELTDKNRPARVVLFLLGACLGMAGLLGGCTNQDINAAALSATSWYVRGDTGVDEEGRGYSPATAFGSLTWAIEAARKSDVKTIILLESTNPAREAAAATLLGMRSAPDMSAAVEKALGVRNAQNRAVVNERTRSTIIITHRHGQLIIKGEGPAGSICIKAGAGERAVFVDAVGKVYFENLSITGGHVAGDGGGIYVEETGSVTLGPNVLVSGNQANSGKGSGIYLESGSILKFAGNAQVKQPDEVFLHSGNQIILIGKLTASPAAVIRLDDPTGLPRVLSGRTEGNSDKFHIINTPPAAEGYYIDSNGQLREKNPVPPPAVTYTITNNAPFVQNDAHNGYVTIQVNNGAAENDASVTASAQDAITVTIYPKASYKLDILTVTGATSSGTGNTRSFTMPAANVTINATFAADAQPPGPNPPAPVAYTIANGVPHGQDGANHGHVTVKVNGGQEEPGASVSAFENDSIVLTIYPAANYTLGDISVNGTSLSKDKNDVSGAGSGATLSFAMPAGNAAVSATFSATPYTITNNAAQTSQSTNHGYVRVKAGSAALSNAASVTAYTADSVTLTVVADTGYELSSITVTAASGSNPTVSGTGSSRSFTMPGENVTIGATFTKTAYSITNNAIAPAGGRHGYVRLKVGSGSISDTSPLTAYYGDAVELTIVPESTGYVLGILTVTGATASGTGNTRAFTMPTGNVTVDATFTQNAPPPPVSYTITNNARPGALTGGSVSVQVGGGTAQTGASVSAKAGDAVTLNISPASGYSLSSITATGVTLSGSGSTRTFTMPAANVTVSATFSQNAPPAPVSYTITNNARSGAITGGSVSVQVGSGTVQTNASVTAYANDTITLAISPATNYSLGTLTVTATSGSNPTVNGNGNGNSRTFTMPAANVTVSATFTQNASPPSPSSKRVSWYVSNAANSDLPSATAEWSGDTVTAALSNIKSNAGKVSGGKKAVVVISGTVDSSTEGAGASGATMFTIKGVYPPLVFRGDATTKGIIDAGNARRIFMIQSRSSGIPNEVTLADDLTLQNGRAVSTTPVDTVGGAVYIIGGTFNMTGGVIKNSVSTSGGAIGTNNWAMDSVPRNQVNLSGGEITGNRNDKLAGLDNEGGAIYIIDGNLSISGTVNIHDNGTDGKTLKGGAVYLLRSTIGTEMTMSGGTIQNNKATGDGGGVYVGAKCVFTISNGTITGNTAGQGGGVFIYKSQYVQQTAWATFNNNGGTITGNTPNNVYP